MMKGGTVLKVCDFGTVTNLRTIMTQDQGKHHFGSYISITIHVTSQVVFGL